MSVGCYVLFTFFFMMEYDDFDLVDAQPTVDLIRIRPIGNVDVVMILISNAVVTWGAIIGRNIADVFSP